MRILYMPPEAEAFYVWIEGNLCNTTIPGAGGEDRDPWNPNDDYED